MPAELPQQQGFSEHFPDEDFATNWAIAWLRDRGFLIHLGPKFQEVERPIDLHTRIAPEMNRATFYRRLNHPGRPAFFNVAGKTGRLIKLRATPALEEWLTRPIAASRKAKGVSV